jgi:primosomal protein N' (replication factor Y)
VRGGGRVVVVAESTLRPVQALVRWDPAGFAGLELAERQALGFPPASRMAAVAGAPSAVRDFTALVRLPEGAELLGPVAAGEGQERVLIRVPTGRGSALSAALKAARVAWAARGRPEPVRVRVDPPDIG